MAADAQPSETRNDADYYDFYELGNVGDADFYVEKAVNAKGLVLELGCGTGRVLIQIARAGVGIWGLDLSAEMLANADRKLLNESAETRNRVTLIEGDMRTFSIDRRFALIIVPFRSFQHMMTPTAQLECLQTIARHLEPGGTLVFDIFDPDIEYISAHKGSLGAAQKLDARFWYPAASREVLVWESSEYDQTEQVLTQIRTFEELTPSHVSALRYHSGLEVRYTFRFEMEHLLARAGFTVEALVGDFYGNPFQAGKNQVWAVKLSDLT